MTNSNTSGEDLFKTGEEYYSRKDYTKALNHYTEAAEQHDHLNSQYALGVMYILGEGVVLDSKKSLYWFTKAEKNGSKDDQYSKGVLYFTGDEGIDKDHKKASQWFQKTGEFDLNIYISDEKSGALFSYHYGLIHENGFGYPVSYGVALKCFTESAENGYACAMLKLGLMYQRGKGVQVDNALAYQWFTRAKNNGCSVAELNLGLLYLDPTYALHDYEKAMHCFRKALDGDTCAYANFYIGYIYDKGLGVKKDEYVALQLFKKSADQGYSVAQHRLGQIYVAARNYKEAVFWFTKSAENDGNANSQFDLSSYYLLGLGVAKNEGIAVEFIRKSANQGHSDAQDRLGVMYLEGRGIEQSFSKSMLWFQKAVENNGNSKSLCSIGDFHHHGLGVDTNPDLALEYYKKSAKLGNKVAIKNIYIISRDKIKADSLPSANEDIQNLNSGMASLEILSNKKRI